MRNQINVYRAYIAHALFTFVGRYQSTNKIYAPYKLTSRNSKSANMETWRGVPLADIYGSASPWGSPEFPLVAPAYNHAVMYHIAHSGGAMPGNKPPSPQRGQDKWDKEFVRMPCSAQSLYPVLEEDGSTSILKRWDVIKSALQRPIRNSHQLADAICSYNTKFKSQWRFTALHYLFNEYLEEEESEYFFSVTLPAIAKLALSLPQLMQSPLPLLRQHKNRSVSLTQEQIASLLANAFFCTFPRRNNSKRTSEYSTFPHINFNTLYESSATPSVMEKLKCICHYLRRVCTKVGVGVVTFSRRTVEPVRCPAWRDSMQLVGQVPLHANSSGTIEDDGVGLIQVDFANKYLGGGVLSHGCVQEEIRFVICPELLVSMLFTEVLRPTEALLIIGCERYSSYTGYGSSFQWSGDYEDRTPHDSSGRRRCAVVAIDALPFASERQQYRPEVIDRELNKAWVGFSAGTSPTDATPLHRPGVATGNWGCGAFGGSPSLKWLLQLMACAEARRPMAYYTFGDVQLRNRIVKMYNYLSQRHVTVGQLYSYLIRFSRSGVGSGELYAFIQQLQQDSTSHQPVTQEPELNTEASSSDIVEDHPKRILSPDLFSSSEPSSQADLFVDLERGEGTLKVDLNVNSCVVHNEQQSKAVHKEADIVDSYRHSDDIRPKPLDDKAAEENVKAKHSDDKASELNVTAKPLDDKASEQNVRATASHQTKSLFDDMTKLDSESTTSSFTKSSESVFKAEVGMADVTNEEFTLDEEMSIDVSVETCVSGPLGIVEDVEIEKVSAKRLGRKITDYFSKKF